MRPIPAVIAALPRELSGLVKGWKAQRLAGHVWVYTNGEAVAACAGMGPARAALAVEAAMTMLPVTELISVGIAGACDAVLQVGDVVRAGVVVDARTGERFGDAKEPVLVTTEAVAGVREKARLRASYGAAAVDMEAATVARLARAHGLEFVAIKAVSDAADFEMEELRQFVTPEGQFREGAFALHAAVRPAMWGRVMELAQNSGKALEALTAEIQAELDLYRKED